MGNSEYKRRLALLARRHEDIISRKNKPSASWINGWYQRYHNPVLTRDHIPLSWRYDLNPETNPRLMERQGVNAVLNPGAIELDGKINLICRIEGYDRKSFFGVAESSSGTDSFKFHEFPCEIPETDNPDTNVYDMRLTKHEDGWIYGVFCTERKDPDAPHGDTSSAVAKAGIARTTDLVEWKRLPDLKTKSPQQRNVVLHPELVDGKYAFYTRPQDSFLEAGSGGGIAWGLCDDIENALIDDELVIDPKEYHTVKELKNGMGAPPLKTKKGWLHIAHGVRSTAAGLRYVLYTFLCDPDKPWKVTARPGGYFLAPLHSERIGDVSNVVFCNGVVMKDNGEVFIYYASSDTRIHVARSDINTLLDYTLNTPEDRLRSFASVTTRKELIKKNRDYILRSDDPLLEKVD